MKDQLVNYMDRPKRYEYIDGTGEMAMGVMLVSFALYGYLSAVLPEGALWRKNGLATFEIMAVVMIPILVFQYWGVKAIKQHITWPRTGYVAYRRGGWSWWKVVFATLVLGGVLGASVVCVTVLERRFHALSLERAGYLAVMLAAYALFVFFRSREHAWKWLVVLFMALGLLVIAAVVPGDVYQSFRHVALFVGLVWLGSGLGTLYSYIRHTQPSAPKAE
jgi:MFS family permease